MKYRTFVLFGAPGSGKGTQGKTLGTIPRFYHCPCGDVFRSIDTRTKVGKAFLEYSSKGQLVPDDVTVELWKEAIDAAVDGHKFKPDIDIPVLERLLLVLPDREIFDYLCTGCGSSVGSREVTAGDKLMMQATQPKRRRAIPLRPATR